MLYSNAYGTSRSDFRVCRLVPLDCSHMELGGDSFDVLLAEIDRRRRAGLAVSEEERVKVTAWDLFRAVTGNQRWPPIIEEISRLNVAARDLPYPEAREIGVQVGQLFWRLGCEHPMSLAALSQFILSRFELTH